jgi:hypothetical protein
MSLLETVLRKSLKSGPTVASSIMTMLQLTENCLFQAVASTKLLLHPPYSPDLAPSYFWLLPKLRSTLKGQELQGMY